ncbi:MAG: carbohydrate binding domain-containing protein [Pirellulales bacterium]|nr:carbohydrate binding domain-containing protein [Pirellulales bacterium]
MIRQTVFSMLLVAASAAAAAGQSNENLLVGGDFEEGLSGWSEFWTRTPGGQVTLDAGLRHGGRQSARIEHTGTRDWSFQQQKPLQVVPGQIYELGGFVRLDGEGSATLCVTLRGAGDRVLDWSFGGRSTQATPWRRLRCRFIIPPGAETIQPRLIGQGPAKVWFDDARLVLTATLDQLRAKDLPEKVDLVRGDLQLTFHVAGAALSVVDRRTGRQWVQPPAHDLVVLEAKRHEHGFRLVLLEPAEMLRFEAAVGCEPERPEVVVELSADGELSQSLAFPRPFVSGKGTFLVMPVNEGISYPVDDESLPPMHYHLYGGHGLCMGWYGVTDGERGMMTIVETPDDAAVRVPRRNGLLCLAPEWIPQKGRFGPARRLRYVFLDRGGYVAMCQRYRQHARQTGLLKTMAEKREANPNVDLLIGAVNVWCWDRDAAAICREMQAVGIGRILWSHRGDPEVLRQLNKMNVLTSRYDIYQDVMNPEHFPRLGGVHPDWTTEAWPDDLMIGADGQRIRGWQVKAKDGEMIPCGVLCDMRAVDYARRRIPAELETHAYRCRFIDTTTASSWRECYHEDHPATRSDSRRARMDLLRFVSEECHLVTGSETGHEAAVPFVHYFEGMLSLGPYRVPDAGRAMMKTMDDVPERVAKFQTGHFYRLPLWELVYHDCVVAQWYWGDYNNKLPKLWDRRDLFNALYGTPPMFMFDRRRWQDQKDRFVQSYRATAPIARATGYVEMLSHRWLTADHAVQQTRFGNGVTVTVNFGDKPYPLENGTILEPLGRHVRGLAPPVDP